MPLNIIETDDSPNDRKSISNRRGALDDRGCVGVETSSSVMNMIPRPPPMTQHRNDNINERTDASSPHDSSVISNCSIFIDSCLSKNGTQSSKVKRRKPKLSQHQRDHQGIYDNPKQTMMVSPNDGIQADCHTVTNDDDGTTDGVGGGCYHDVSKESAKKLLDEPAPKRPMSAYNLFFHLERRRLLDGADEKVFTTEDVAEFALQQRLNGHLPKPKRPHRKTHGKIGFTDLARAIGNRWKQLDDDAKNVFHGYYEIEMIRYKQEYETWNDRQIQLREADKVSNAAGKIVEDILEQWHTNANHSTATGNHNQANDMGPIVTSDKPPILCASSSSSIGVRQQDQRDMMMMMSSNTDGREARKAVATSTSSAAASSRLMRRGGNQLQDLSSLSKNHNSMLMMNGMDQDDIEYELMLRHHQRRFHELTIRRQQRALMTKNKNAVHQRQPIAAVAPEHLHFTSGRHDPRLLNDNDTMMLMTEQQFMALQHQQQQQQQRDKQVLNRYRIPRSYIPTTDEELQVRDEYDQEQFGVDRNNRPLVSDMTNNAPYYMADQTFDYALQTLMPGNEVNDDDASSLFLQYNGELHQDCPMNVGDSYDPRLHAIEAASTSTGPNTDSFGGRMAMPSSYNNYQQRSRLLQKQMMSIQQQRQQLQRRRLIAGDGGNVMMDINRNGTMMPPPTAASNRGYGRVPSGLQPAHIQHRLRCSEYTGTSNVNTGSLQYDGSVDFSSFDSDILPPPRMVSDSALEFQQRNNNYNLSSMNGTNNNSNNISNIETPSTHQRFQHNNAMGTISSSSYRHNLDDSPFEFFDDSPINIAPDEANHRNTLLSPPTATVKSSSPVDDSDCMKNLFM